jgi:hypothetical protein
VKRFFNFDVEIIFKKAIMATMYIGKHNVFVMLLYFLGQHVSTHFKSSSGHF